MRGLTAGASRGFAIGMVRPVAVWPAVWERRFLPNEQSLDEKSESRQRRGLKESGKHVGSRMKPFLSELYTQPNE